MKYSVADQPVYGIGYVVATDAEEAYQLMRTSLEERNIGFRGERELETIELLAEQTAYPNCCTILYMVP
jgi:cobalamin biosynthesis protein CbiG